MSNPRLNIHDVCDMLKLSKTIVYRRIEQGFLPKPIKDGRRSFWRLQDILNYIDQEKTA